MGSLVQPIAGNQSFTNVANLAGQLTNLDVSSASASNLQVNNLRVDNQLQAETFIDNQWVERVVVGYAPLGFATLADGGVVNLNSAPGFPAALNAADPNLLLLPTGAMISRLTITNNGTALAPGAADTVQVDAGVPAFPAAAGALSLVAATAASVVNGANGAAVGQGLEAFLPTLGTAAVDPADGVLQTTVPSSVTVTKAGGANTGGDIRVAINYSLPIID